MASFREILGLNRDDSLGSNFKKIVSRLLSADARDISFTRDVLGIDSFKKELLGVTSIKKEVLGTDSIEKELFQGDTLRGVVNEIRDIRSSRSRPFFDSLVRGISRFTNKISGLMRVARPRSRRGDPALSDNLEKLIADSRERMMRVGEALKTNKIDIDQFLRQMETEIRRGHLAAAILGSDGAGNLSRNQLNLIDRQVSQQLAAVRRMATRITTNVIAGRKTTGREVHQAGQFAQALRVTATQTRRQLIKDSFGETAQERRRMSPADHCGDCVEAAGMGWQPIGTLPPIGDSECGSNCRCYFEYSHTGDDTGTDE